ncbi:ImmA/IrrE family metallo-endopeptidase [Bacillus inaquosorum]|uniref:ImmA/IrrE family metallo-endopeptidase n=1 Tax=Bacillus inaquosorum TaxID=483913 RepID=UPI000745B8C5|nr:ImmA/IrrE family metallo-endopeptidase [Bacillus inaquosorum]PPA35986.1 ImmA/IrrE family metallo-endopeptidase [Bacillus subtilis]AMA54592.1 peptidase [Bacillus inaquosorum]MBT2193301.1 ImmA/IrrE family metallo-endopeptidase [Bacillus inaquosorum]MBT3120200.1 ImmA/IrrE family metallo-endopeptidase [Bacillus inaquosorum]MBT3124382.1 ImmA/IrrE family metallo-endopeptidase [Bacillus inaquosorum]
MILIYTSKNIKNKAERVIQEHGTNDVYEICGNLNISILKSNLGRIKGFLQYYKKHHHYLIQVNQKYQNTKIIIAHELGHYFLHKNLNTFKMENCSLVLGEKLEHQANIFATELLLPDYVLTNEASQLQNWTLNQIASFFQLPVPIVEHKVRHMNLLSPNIAINQNRLTIINS